MKKYLAFLLVPFVFASCEKEGDNGDPNPPVSEVPYIELQDVSPMMVSQFDGPIVFTIFFQDGDGDIGFEDADSSALFLTDERFPLTEGYHIPPQTPGGAELTIQGTWELHLDHTILMDPYASSETATFRLKLRDRAGNWSNEVVSPPITITQ